MRSSARFCQGSECWFCFAGSWAVDRGRSSKCSNKCLRSVISLFHSHCPKQNKKTSCIFIHKIINNVIIGCCFLFNQLQFYLLFAWVGGEIREIISKFPTFQLFHLFMENELYSAKKCNTESLCTSFPQWAEWLWVALSRVPSPCVLSSIWSVAIPK